MGVEIFSLSGKVALVTGASQGIGYSLALGLAECGADVVVTSRNAEEIAAAGEAIRAATGRRVLALRADVSVAADVDAVVAQAVEEFGSVDILVNNAGFNRPMPIKEMDLDAWNQVVGAFLTGAMLGARAVTPQMMRQGSGRIINNASMFGLVGYPRWSNNNAAKGGLINLTRALAVELAPHGITVNCICPGPIETPVTANLFLGAVREQFESRVPLGRLGTPDDLVGAVVYLASDAASFTTGAVLSVDGGWTAQ